MRDVEFPVHCGVPAPTDVDRVEGVGVAALIGRLRWSLQRPERRAVERDDSEIARWIAHEWPRIKKGP
ncbi:winged helix-turn-helix domain-containing protein [Streptomyces sp. B4I13]|uniref:winged helix-turn-helix domain-containing protein n=1 Tax=Streptomyces sp. B4I13 TaxID=3042271 RepID=UPI003593CD4F